MAVRLVICDDSSFARRSVVKALPADVEFSVVEASNAAECLTVCRAGGVDLLFLDLTMPDVSGFEVLASLQADGIRFPIIVISADVQRASQDRARALGARAFLPKPISVDKIKVLIEHLRREGKL